LYFCIVDLGKLGVPLVTAAVYRCCFSGGWFGVGESSAKSEETSVPSRSSSDAVWSHSLPVSSLPSFLNLRPNDGGKTT
jgi:hypothetical protein